ncbi:MAG TPA: transcription elongation factor GreA [Candidatus Alectryocaccobium stercorigallinarum]|nr:transcription elongation factor GreA [Candidatus Alectryocaccobium stercorigallinarum]
MYDNLTKSDIQKMEEEIEHRKLVVRKETIQAVKEARAFGDLSENFEYYAAKQAKNQNESRIRYLENMIKTANIIEDNSADDEVGINKRVEILFEDDNETEEYKIVTSVRGDSLEGRITPESPLGAALMGHRAGDRVEVKVNAKDHASSYFIKILNVKNTGEEAADVLRSF